MKYFAVNLTDSFLFDSILYDSESDLDAAVAAANMTGNVFKVEVADNYDTQHLFDSEPVITVTTAEDKTLMVTIFEIHKDYTAFNANIDIVTETQIKDWCRAQTKNEEYYITRAIDNDNTDSQYVTYKTNKDSIKSFQAAFKKINVII